MRRWAKVVLGLLAVVVVLVAVAAVAFVRRPMRALEMMGRAALRGSGFQHETLAGPAGPLSLFHKGTGRAVLLLHGVNDQAGAWAGVAGALAEDRRVVVPDLPGHGGSAPGSGPLTVDDVVAGAEAIVAREAAAGPVDLVGNSMGGWIALLVARAHPEQVRRVVLVNAAVLRGSDAGVRLVPRTREEARHAVRTMMGPRGRDVPDYVLDDMVRRAPDSAMARLGARPIEPRHLLDGRLGEIGTPVALVWGEADGLLTVDYARTVAAGLPAASLITLKDCGHIPQRECPQDLVPALRTALGAP